MDDRTLDTAERSAPAATVLPFTLLPCSCRPSTYGLTRGELLAEAVRLHRAGWARWELRCRLALSRADLRLAVAIAGSQPATPHRAATGWWLR